jgi:hypothetical protein
MVDTKFVSVSGTEDPREPAAAGGKPGIVGLTAQNWDVQWTIEGWIVLDTARLITEETKLFQGVKTTGKMSWRPLNNEDENLLAGNVVTLRLEADTAGFVNVNLEYVPFSKATEDFLSAVTAIYGDDAEVMAPEWIIRNGVNDKAQNNTTDFTNFHQVDGEGLTDLSANGNGAVRFVVNALAAARAQTPTVTLALTASAKTAVQAAARQKAVMLTTPAVTAKERQVQQDQGQMTLRLTMG